MLRIYNCGECSARYVVAAEQSGNGPTCMHCNGQLLPVIPGQGRVIPPFPDHALYERFRRDAPEPSSDTRVVWEPGEHLLDQYKIEKDLGSGGKGAVYLVHSVHTGEPFAVKKILPILGEDERYNFLTELCTWTDLPEHPHLVACRFMRTIGEQIVIFVEYMDGNSLKKWINDGKLMELEALLDVAIQFAWGLHAAHEAGLVHQEVKPANALLTAERQLKVSDFGMANLRPVSSGILEAGWQASGVTARAGTQEYCSPEQAEGRKVTRQTDVWSWGVSVLHLFNGDMSWKTGQAGPRVLQNYQRNGPHNRRLPPMPAGLIHILNRCFCANPRDRWPNMSELAERLKEIYRSSLGKEYPRPTPLAPARNREQIEHVRWSNLGFQWDDPRDYLVDAFQEKQRSLEGAKKFLPPSTGLRNVQVLKDLAVYDEALRIFTQLVDAGRPDLRVRVSRICMEKAVVHRELGDGLGALALYSRAIENLKLLVQQEEEDADVDLARAYLNKGIVLFDRGHHQAAVNLYDEAIRVLKPIVYDEGRSQFANDLAKVYQNKANALDEIGYVNAADEFFHQSGLLREWLMEEKGEWDLLREYAETYMNWAVVGQRFSQFRKSVDLYERAIASFQALLSRTAEDYQLPVRYPLGLACLNKATALLEMRDLDAALDACDWAIVIFTRLEYGKQQDCRNELAAAYFNKAHVLQSRDKPALAFGWCLEAIKFWDRLVRLSGRPELQSNLQTAEQLLDRIRTRLQAVATPRNPNGRTAPSLIGRIVARWRQRRQRKKPE